MDSSMDSLGSILSFSLYFYHLSSEYDSDDDWMIFKKLVT